MVPNHTRPVPTNPFLLPCSLSQQMMPLSTELPRNESKASPIPSVSLVGSLFVPNTHCHFSFASRCHLSSGHCHVLLGSLPWPLKSAPQAAAPVRSPLCSAKDLSKVQTWLCHPFFLFFFKSLNTPQCPLEEKIIIMPSKSLHALDLATLIIFSCKMRMNNTGLISDSTHLSLVVEANKK